MKPILSQEDYQKRIKEVLISEEEIQNAVIEAAKKIDALYDGHPILLVGVLKGSFMFMSDICQKVTVPCEVAFMRAQSYFDGTVSSGNVKILMDIDRDVTNYHLVVLEDIVDTGRTLLALTDHLKKKNPQSFTLITLLDKPSRRVAAINPDYSLFTIPDSFVIGYGLDCAEFYRNLPYIAVYDESFD